MQNIPFISTVKLGNWHHNNWSFTFPPVCYKDYFRKDNTSLLVKVEMENQPRKFWFLEQTHSLNLSNKQYSVNFSGRPLSSSLDSLKTLIYQTHLIKLKVVRNASSILGRGKFTSSFSYPRRDRDCGHSNSKLIKLEERRSRSFVGDPFKSKHLKSITVKLGSFPFLASSIS